MFKVQGGVGYFAVTGDLEYTSVMLNGTDQNTNNMGEGISLSVDLGGGLLLSNPMMTASGTCGYADEYRGLMDMSRLGAFVTKSITLRPRAGNESYRVVETRGGMLNAIGLANIGLDDFIKQKLPVLSSLRGSGPRVIVNVAGHSVDDYVQVAGRLASEEVVDGIELNVSCPNVNDGLTFGTSPVLLKELVKEVAGAVKGESGGVKTGVRKQGGVSLIVKLSPNVADISLTARAAIEGGADILSMINTYTAMAVDIYKRRPRLANGTGGLSGPAIRPLAVYLVSKVYREVARDASVPIIGMGGIQYWQDAVEFLLAGATGLAVGTSLFIDPAIPIRIQDGIRDYLREQGCRSVGEIVGTLAVKQ